MDIPENLEKTETPFRNSENYVRKSGESTVSRKLNFATEVLTT